jgi:hypothetical protein
VVPVHGSTVFDLLQPVVSMKCNDVIHRYLALDITDFFKKITVFINHPDGMQPRF